MHDVEVNKRRDSGKAPELEASLNSLDEKEESIGAEGKKSGYGSLLKNWPLMSTIIVYCVFSLQEIAYSEVSCLPNTIIVYCVLLVLEMCQCLHVQQGCGSSM